MKNSIALSRICAGILILCLLLSGCSSGNKAGKTTSHITADSLSESIRSGSVTADMIENCDSSILHDETVVKAVCETLEEYSSNDDFTSAMSLIVLLGKNEFTYYQGWEDEQYYICFSDEYYEWLLKNIQSLGNPVFEENNGYYKGMESVVDSEERSDDKKVLTSQGTYYQGDFKIDYTDEVNTVTAKYDFYVSRYWECYFKDNLVDIVETGKQESVPSNTKNIYLQEKFDDTFVFGDNLFEEEYAGHLISFNEDKCIHLFSSSYWENSSFKGGGTVYQVEFRQENIDIWESFSNQYRNANSEDEKNAVIEQVRQYGEANLTGVYRDESLGNGKAFSWKSDEEIYVLTGMSQDIDEIEGDENRKCSFKGFDGEYLILSSSSGKEVYVKFVGSPDQIICMNYTGTGEQRTEVFYRLGSESLEEANEAYEKKN